MTDRSITYLHVALGDIERCDSSVRDTARKRTTEHALGIVAGVVGNRPKVPAHVGTVNVSDAVPRMVGRVWRDAHRASHFPEGARWAMGDYLGVGSG